MSSVVKISALAILYWRKICAANTSGSGPNFVRGTVEASHSACFLLFKSNVRRTLIQSNTNRFQLFLQDLDCTTNEIYDSVESQIRGTVESDTANELTTC